MSAYHSRAAGLQVDRAERLQFELHLAVGDVVLPHEPELHEPHAGGDLGVHDAPRVVDGRRERLLAERGQTRPDRRDGQFGVRVVGR